MSEKRASSWLSKTSSPASAFFSCVEFLARYRLLRRIALEVLDIIANKFLRLPAINSKVV